MAGLQFRDGKQDGDGLAFLGRRAGDAGNLAAVARKNAQILFERLGGRDIGLDLRKAAAGGMCSTGSSPREAPMSCRLGSGAAVFSTTPW